MTEAQRDVMKRAAVLLVENDKIRKALRQNEADVSAMCREYGDAFGIWGCAPYHLRRAAEAQGLLDKVV